ncbi:hypothetical protein [Pseudovibrio sp. Tun.PSC04-5.I4]|uniref:hypothetical protein n=1 Tax=Pseudovibrio sp. Tun.PSC04-5.I4 TaxID=1798213 RepID=UPI000888BE3B|nr:hypothetical protein [Pseudovibrio sp. Tun.PSC04-5.I4]SDQ73368.1 hypothetical protein SAMN04515695_1173 [Pseudovibrio sp. Tun.PSC04-5.I4]
MMSILLRQAPYAIIAAALASALWLFADYVRDQERLQAELKNSRLQLTQAQAALVCAEEVARVHRAYLQQAEAKAERWEELANELQSMEGRDATLSDFLHTAAERLYGKRKASTSDNSPANHSRRSPAPLPRAAPQNEGQLIDALGAEKRGRECTNGKLKAIGTMDPLA